MEYLKTLRSTSEKWVPDPPHPARNGYQTLLTQRGMGTRPSSPSEEWVPGSLCLPSREWEWGGMGTRPSLEVTRHFKAAKNWPAYFRRPWSALIDTNWGSPDDVTEGEEWFSTSVTLLLDPVIRWPGDPVIRWSGDPVTRWPGDPVIRWPGDPVTRWG